MAGGSTPLLDNTALQSATSSTSSAENTPGGFNWTDFWKSLVAPQSQVSGSMDPYTGATPGTPSDPGSTPDFAPMSAQQTRTPKTGDFDWNDFFKTFTKAGVRSMQMSFHPTPVPSASAPAAITGGTPSGEVTPLRPSAKRARALGTPSLTSPRQRTSFGSLLASTLGGGGSGSGA